MRNYFKNEGNTLQFIQEVQQREVLWNKWNPIYKSRTATDAEWDNMAKIFNKSRDDLKTKWKNLRDTFQRELRKLRRPSPGQSSGSNKYIYTGRWSYFETMLFLKDVMVVNTENADEAKDDTSDDDQPEVSILDAQLSQSSVKVEVLPRFQEQMSDVVPNAEPKRSTIKKAPKRKIGMTPFENRFLRMMDKNMRMLANPDRREEEDEEEISSYLKSLMPYFKKISAVRRLAVRNKFQKILMAELGDNLGQGSTVASSPNSDDYYN